MNPWWCVYVQLWVSECELWLFGVYCIRFRCSWFSLPINILTANSCSSFFFRCPPGPRAYLIFMYVPVSDNFSAISICIQIADDISAFSLLNLAMPSQQEMDRFWLLFFLILVQKRGRDRQRANNARAANFTWQCHRICKRFSFHFYVTPNGIFIYK